MTRYEKGFLAKCASFGLAPSTAFSMLKLAQSFGDGTFTLQPGQYLSHVVQSWNREHPDQKITVDQLVQANGGLDPTRYRAGKAYQMPAMQRPAVPADAAQAQPAAVPAEDAVKEPGRHWGIFNGMYRRTPTGAFLRDVARSNVNRAARWAGITDEDKSLIPGGTVSTLSNEQMDWLRMAIQAQNGGKVPASGGFGGARWKLGKSTDDYKNLVHPGFSYAHFPNTDREGSWYDPRAWGITDKWRTQSWRGTGVPNQIEYMLGDWRWSTDDNGNIIVNDTYDFNNGEGNSQKDTSYGGIRGWAGRHASKSSDPDSGKTKFSINLGNPKTWSEYDANKFHAFNEPYRERFPDQFIYNPKEENVKTVASSGDRRAIGR